MGNLVYAYFYDRTDHVDGCSEEKGCAEECSRRRFEEWLDAPLMPWEIREDAERQDRLRSVKRGEMPA